MQRASRLLEAAAINHRQQSFGVFVVKLHGLPDIKNFLI
jgi:hypothetical protein